MKNLLIIIILTLLFSGCVSKQENSYQNLEIDENNELQQNNETDESPNDSKFKKSFNSHCERISDPILKNQCLAYSNQNISQCNSFKNENRDKCIFEISINSKNNKCIDIKDKNLRWKCEAVVTNDISNCKYTLNKKEELYCHRDFIRITENKTNCNYVNDKKEDFIDNPEKYGYQKNSIINGNRVEYDSTDNFEIFDNDNRKVHYLDISCEEDLQLYIDGRKSESLCNRYDCELYEGKSCDSFDSEFDKSNCLRLNAFKNLDYKKCLLIQREVRRDECLNKLAFELKDPNICKEKVYDEKNCIDNIARKHNLTFCTDEYCIINSIKAMKISNQSISYDVCDKLSDKNKNICLAELSKSKFYRKNNYYFS